MRCVLSRTGQTDSMTVHHTDSMTVLDTALELNPRVALRPEPFGALAYNYANRRLVFLKHPDMVKVANSLAHHDSLRATLEACDIAPERWNSFVTAFESLKSSEVVRER